MLPAFFTYIAWVAVCHHPEGAPIRTLWERGPRRARAVLADGRAWLPAALTAGLAFLVPFGLCSMLLLWHNAARWGNPFDNGYGVESFSTPLEAGLYGLLLSPGRSLFLYAPLTALAVAAWPAFWRRQPATATLYAAVVLITVVQYACWWGWWGGWCWGPRYLLPILPFAFLALGPALERSRLARFAAWPLAALGFDVSLLGALIDFHPYMIELTERFGLEVHAFSQPRLSPILAHAEYLRAGRYISVATFDMQRFGFGPVAAQFFPLFVAALFAAGLWLLLRRPAAQRGRTPAGVTPSSPDSLVEPA
ncbi:MAG: hypothetical protein M3Q65_01375 [Chloroflexota bacterium]|nr:hypothetical protein [Chloroflexota bacterium]